MRLQLHLTPNTEPVPFNHLHQLTGALHKWLGKNEIHDGLSLYSFGWLRRGRSKNKAENLDSRGSYLSFPEGAVWNVSFYNDEVGKKLLEGILLNPELFSGMKVREACEQAVPSFGNFYRFHTDQSAILARRVRPNGTREYLLWNDSQADDVLTHLLRQKLKVAGWENNHLDVQVRFDRSYEKARSRKITIKGINHKGSECPVWIAGTPEAVQFAWLVGLGDLTGSGFGGLL